MKKVLLLITLIQCGFALSHEGADAGAAEISRSSSQAYDKYKKDRIEKKEDIKKRMANLNYIPEVLINIISDFFIPCSEQEFQKNTIELIPAIEDNNYFKIQNLLEIGADVNVKDKNGWAALILAAHICPREIVELLINHGADLNIKSESANLIQTESGNWSALLIAAYDGRKEIVELLINHGADLNIQNSNGWTALKWAKYFGHKEIVKLLKSRVNTQCTIL